MSGKRGRFFGPHAEQEEVMNIMFEIINDILPHIFAQTNWRGTKITIDQSRSRNLWVKFQRVSYIEGMVARGEHVTLEGRAAQNRPTSW